MISSFFVGVGGGVFKLNTTLRNNYMALDTVGNR